MRSRSRTDVCLHHPIEEQVIRTPDAIAVRYEDGYLTYGQLDAVANRIANYLLVQEIGAGTLVGIFLEPSLNAIAALLGVLKAGAAYVPLDPSYPPDRLKLMLQDACAPRLLTEKRLLDRLPASDAQAVLIDDAPITAQSETRPHVGIQADEPAYVIYTSGSTGQPKGTLVSHRNVVHSTRARFLYYREPVDSFLLLSSLSFDSSVAGVYWTLWGGGTLVLASGSVQRDPQAIVQALRHYNVSHTLTVPSVYSTLLPLLEPEEVPHLRTIIVAGEVCGSHLVQEHWDRLPHVHLFNEYGPTEGTVWSTVFDCDQYAGCGSIPIGLPIPGVRVYVLDDQQRLVPTGETGELYIGGAGVAQGYLNRPDLTAQRFIADPFSGGRYDRLYRTGDLGRYGPDGNLRFLGRVDQQVKLHGNRVELGEIETVLESHPAVLQGAIAAREGASGTTRLHAYFVPRPKQKVSQADLRQFLRKKLPEYMVPSTLVPLQSLPLTPNGKVDRDALPAPQPRRDENGAFVAARNTVEERLARIWADVLQLDRVSIDDTFTGLGGDSLLAMQIIARAAREGLRLTPADIAGSPTVARLASVAQPVPAPSRTDDDPVHGPVVLTPAQRRIFERDGTLRRKPARLPVDFTTRLDADVLEAAVLAVVKHHDGLRMRFVEADGGWKSFNAAAETNPVFFYEDVSMLPPDDQERAIRKRTSRIRRNIEISTGPLVQFIYFNLGEQRRGRALLLVDHLVVDAYSLVILMQDIELAYRQRIRGERVHLPAKTTSVKQWGESLAAFARSTKIREEIDYWLALPWDQIPSQPVDWPQHIGAPGQLLDVLAALTWDETEALLHQAPRRLDAQFNDVLLTALALGYREWCGVPLLPIELRTHGREPLSPDVDLSRTVGLLTSTFPAMLHIGRAADPTSALQRVKRQIRSVPRGGIGFDVLRYLSDDEHLLQRFKRLPRLPLKLNFQGHYDQLYAGLSLFSLSQPLHTRPPEGQVPGDARLVLVGRVQDGRLYLRCQFHECLYRQPTVDRFMESVIAALRSFVALAA